MSQDMLIGCLETSLFFELVSLGHSAFLCPGLSGPMRRGVGCFVGVDGEFAEDFSGVAVDDDDV